MRRIPWILASLFLITAGTQAGERPAAPQMQTLSANPAAAPSLRHLRNKAASHGSVRVIVGLNVSFAPETKLAGAQVARQRSSIAGARWAVVKNLSDGSRKSLRKFDSLPFVAVTLTPAELEAVAANPDTLSITEDHLNKLSLAESVPLIQGTAAWDAGYRGLGQTVAIIDSGVDAAHPFLAGKVVSEACYSAGGWCPGGRTVSIGPGSARPCPVSECAHGTHVAGIAAGRGPDFSGVAKDATIIAIQVMSPVGGGARAYDSDILAGLYRVLELKDTFRIAAVNMSLGSDTVSGGYCDQLSGGSINPYKTVIDDLKENGIATVISSGNGFSTSGISSPACVSSAISVGAVSDSAWGLCNGVASAVDKVACYSNSAPILSLLAPGSLITSSVPNRKFAAYHGTSMAAPHVTGAWALLKEKAPSATVEEILAALQNTGKPITDYRNLIVKPRINVKAALDQLPDSRVALTYINSGPALGNVTFTPAGSIASCRVDCVNHYTAGTQVTLQATPEAGARFFGWGGACSGTGACTVSMSAPRTVSASFFTGNSQTLTYVKAGSGSGNVTLAAGGFTSNCGTSCTRTYWQDATVTLTAQPAAGSTFAGWSGGVCLGQKESCTLRLSGAKSVTATFQPLAVNTLTYTRQGLGQGSVSFGVASAGSCSDSCTKTFQAGTLITMAANPALGSVFVGWSGICVGPKQTCVFPINASGAITANFRTSTSASAAR